ncbi:MAG: CBS domain-containing protein [Oscillospiraceae bacterium]|nr:CBS domain-containing protein [Oscillospiraceae bacterium]
MKLRDIMTSPVIRIDPQESVAVAARTLTHYNIGMLPVCGSDGRICGVVTDRDIVTRCLAAGRAPASTTVREIMSSNVIAAMPDTDAAAAARVMGHKQIRRLPVVENEKLCGMVSIGDLANCDEITYDAGDALAEISNSVSGRK